MAKRINQKFSSQWLLLAILILAAIIRLWRLSSNPISLYWDEMDVGYQAYSLVALGKDYFGTPFAIHLHSFADFRTPLYIYATIPFVWALGLTAWAVRLPAALFGILSIWFTYLVTVQMTNRRSAGLVAALIMTVTPWHVQYSRMAFEVTLMLSLFLFGMYTFYRGLEQKNWLYASAVSFAFAPWVYSTAKLFVPIFILGLVCIYWRRLVRYSKSFLVAIGILLVLVGAPIYLDTFFNGGNTRLSQISIFSDSAITDQVNQLRKQAALTKHPQSLEPTIFEQLQFNKPVFWFEEMSIRYAMAYSPQFLFLAGDKNLRHSPKVDGIGSFAMTAAVALLFGLFVLYKIRRQSSTTVVLLTMWLVLAPLPAAVTRDGAGHATRLFFLLPVLCIIMAFGINYVCDLLKGWQRHALVFGLIVIWAIEFFMFMQYYFTAYRTESSRAFEYGHKEIVTYANRHAKEYQMVIIDAGANWALMPYLFYNQYPIEQLVTQSPYHKMKLNKIGEGIWLNTTIILDPGNRNWNEILETTRIPQKTLVIIPAESLTRVINRTPNSLTYRVDRTINYPDGQPAFYIISVGQ